MPKTNEKEKLMEAAIKLFSVKGYDGTSVDEIAESIGIKGPTIYKYFKGKEALLQAVIDNADEEYYKGMGFGLREEENIHTARQLKEFAMKSLMFTLDNETARRMRRLLTIEQYRNEKFAERATRYQISNITTMYAEIFTRLIGEKVMVNGDPDVIALEFMAPVSLMIQMCDREPHKKDEAMRSIEGHMDSFINRYFIA